MGEVEKLNAEPHTTRLADLPDCWLSISCAPCGRQAKITSRTAINKYGYVTVGDFLHELAVDKLCDRALRSSTDPKAGKCRIKCVAEKIVIPQRPDCLADAVDAGWHLTIRCEAEHAGLKSKRPCMNVSRRMDMETMIVCLGPHQSLNGLHKVLRCPECGRLGVGMYWHLPTNAGRKRA